MNISEAARKNISCVRLPYWNQYAYLELSIEEGQIATFAKLYDPPSTAALWSRKSTENIPYPIIVITEEFGFNEEFEPFNGEKKNPTEFLISQ